MSIVDSNLIDRSRHAYFIGIGGVGMSALARVLRHRGLRVSGSDSKETYTTRELVKNGIPVAIGQKEVGFKDADLIVYSSAIRADHIELQAARALGKKIFHRAEILSSLLNRAKTSIAITGTHGKTTTSSMVSFILTELGREPTCLVGGEVVNLGTNTVLGNSDLWVSEVDESDKTHELYAPNYAIVTNLEEDHMDHYPSLEDLKSSFRRFLSHTRNPGLVVYSDDDSVLKELVLESRRPQINFGFSPSADFSARNIQLAEYGSEFDLYEYGFFSARVKLSVPGMHNIANALAAISVLLQLGLDLDSFHPHLLKFRGARRRLEMKWSSKECTVIDDYAHHPTEVRASIHALKRLGKPLTVVFQPHRFSRTRYFFKQFGQAFGEADEVILTDIYGAGEANTENITVQCIYDEAIASGHPLVRILEKHKILEYLLNPSHRSGVVAFLGAGDIGELADEFANRFKDLTPV